MPRSPLSRISILLGLLIAAFGIQATELKPFTTDGCSVFPDGTASDNAKWMECCVRHDYAYWKGGTMAARAQADQDLKQCVESLGERDISNLMHLGVRVGGSPFFPTWYRWGYGWPYFRGYEPLTDDELAQVTQQLQVLKDLIDQFIAESSHKP